MPPLASGYECPYCSRRELAAIISRDITHIIELRCLECGWEWSVEN